MPAITETPLTVEERIGTFSARLSTVAGEAQNLLRDLTERDIVFALAADTGRIFELVDSSGPLVVLGQLLADRLQQIVNIGHSVDALIDPATIDEVR